MYVKTSSLVSLCSVELLFIMTDELQMNLRGLRWTLRQWILHRARAKRPVGACPKLAHLMLNCRKILTMPAAKVLTAARSNRVALASCQTPLHRMLPMPWIFSTRQRGGILGIAIFRRQQRSHQQILVSGLNNCFTFLRFFLKFYQITLDSTRLLHCIYLYFSFNRVSWVSMTEKAQLGVTMCIL